MSYQDARIQLTECGAKQRTHHRSTTKGQATADTNQGTETLPLGHRAGRRLQTVIMSDVSRRYETKGEVPVLIPLGVVRWPPHTPDE